MTGQFIEEKYLNMEEDGQMSLNGSTSTVPSSSEEVSVRFEPEDGSLGIPLLGRGVACSSEADSVRREDEHGEEQKRGRGEEVCHLLDDGDDPLEVRRPGTDQMQVSRPRLPLIITSPSACYLYEIHNPGGSRPERLWGKEIGRRRRSAGKVKKKKKTSR